LASIAVVPGRDVAALEHLGPHNALEWALYLGLFVLLVAAAVEVIRNSDGAIPRVRKPRNGKIRVDRERKSSGASPAPGSTAPDSDESFDGRDP
jgi:hypothetical protein